MTKRNQQFQTIRTEGAILPPDILRRVASLKVDGATPDAYHLSPGTKINEAISQSWTSLLSHWQAFREARAKLGEDGETGTAVTNERWLLPLFSELDYGRLVTTKSPVIDERSYPIERFYNHTPVHLIGCKLPLDRRTKGARGAATASPHSMVQEFLNQSDEHVWAFLSNGLQLRILRDNVSLSRQTFVEFDLEAMMEGEVYADFALLWLLCHQSRVETEKPEDCWLEKWSRLAREQGTRVLNDLRVGVGNAIEALGRGFIGHPLNDHLREKLHSGSLTKDEFYRQLLRIVYRLLFLFVAEDRELLHSPLPEGERRDEAQKARNLYDEHYSTRRLRELALRMRGTKHADLWHSLSLIFDALGKNQGCPQLGLSALGSFLWRSSSTADLLGPHQANGEAVFITNDDLLQAIRALAYVEQDRALRMVDYRNLGSEELGSVYESLLELHPVMDVDGKSFNLMTAAGNERKTTGSYYTPDSLVQCLLDSALDPVVEERLKGKKGEQAEHAILGIKVCDPASGSGHFLIAAAHRLARHLARIRTGESEPSPEDYQHALRDVIGHCLYGVDINPMAVELCQVSLWMEAIEPGKPLSFLEHHIQCGNSLLGATPALLAKGIPDDAFNAIEGDGKSICSKLKKENKREREDYASGQGYIFSPTIKLGNLPATVATLDRTRDDTLSDVSTKESIYAELVKGVDYQNARLLADTWCAAFIWNKDDSELGRLCPTERDFRSIEENPHSINIHVKAEVERLAGEYNFFHWHLAFPDVFRLPEQPPLADNPSTGWNDGFDVVLGNPPWESAELIEKEYFAQVAPHIAAATNKASRAKLIDALRIEHPDIAARWDKAKRKQSAENTFAKHSGLFPTGSKGKLNSYRLFAELASSIMGAEGCMGLVLKTGIITAQDSQDFISSFLKRGHVRTAIDFINTRLIFSDVVANERFCVLVLLGQGSPPATAQFAFALDSPSQLSDRERFFSLTRDELRILNPNDFSVPPLTSNRDKMLVIHMSRFGALVDTSTNDNKWEVRYSQGHLNSATGSPLFAENTLESLMARGATLARDSSFTLQDGIRLVPVYEGKFIGQMNHRFGTFADVPVKKRFGTKAEANDPSLQDLQCPDYEILPRYWIEESDAQSLYKSKRTIRGWLFTFRDVCRAIVDARTVQACIMPLRLCNDKCPLLIIDADDSKAGTVGVLLNSLWASLPFDYLTRQKLHGSTLTKAIAYQLPTPRATDIESGHWGKPFMSFVWPRAVELTFVTNSLRAFGVDCSYDGPPFRWDEERRFLLRCELDAAYFHLYLGNESRWDLDQPELAAMFAKPRQAVDYIMETFPIVKRKDEQAHGEYRTKRVVLEIYDEMTEAIHTGQPYQTRLDPLPGPPIDAEGNFIPMDEWDPDNWPPHIHKPRVNAT